MFDFTCSYVIEYYTRLPRWKGWKLLRKGRAEDPNGGLEIAQEAWKECLMEWSVRGTRKLTENLTKSRRTLRRFGECVYPLLYARIFCLCPRSFRGRIRRIAFAIFLSPSPTLSHFLLPTTLSRSVNKIIFHSHYIIFLFITFTVSV